MAQHYIWTYPLFDDFDPDPRRQGICDKCGQLTEHPDEIICDACWRDQWNGTALPS